MSLGFIAISLISAQIQNAFILGYPFEISLLLKTACPNILFIIYTTFHLNPLVRKTSHCQNLIMGLSIIVFVSCYDNLRLQTSQK